ncbi:MAG: T9SS type A sorting domain-containing protein [Chitinophagaceae bacterium]
MRLFYIFVSFFIFLNSISAQNCVSLGCASNKTVTTDGTLPDESSGAEWGCYNTYPRKQTFWQIFYSPSGGNYTQSFSCAADLDWIVFDMGVSLTGTACPISPSGWTQVGCDISYNPGGPTGPGVESSVSTTAGHYYAVALILWEPLTITFTFGTPQLAGVNLSGANCPGVLPVKWLSFTGEKQINGAVDLKWITENETKADKYYIEKSKDGINFSAINLQSALQSGGRNTYSYTDATPGTGNTVYRVKQVDFDGRYEYSGLIVIKEKRGKDDITIFPNPAHDVLYITLPERAQFNPARIYDAAGKLVLLTTPAGGLIDLSGLKPGLYSLQLETGKDEIFNKIFIKQ